MPTFNEWEIVRHTAGPAAPSVQLRIWQESQWPVYPDPGASEVLIGRYVAGAIGGCNWQELAPQDPSGYNYFEAMRCEDMREAVVACGDAGGTFGYGPERKLFNPRHPDFAASWQQHVVNRHADERCEVLMLDNFAMKHIGRGMHSVRPKCQTNADVRRLVKAAWNLGFQVLGRRFNEGVLRRLLRENNWQPRLAVNLSDPWNWQREDGSYAPLLDAVPEVVRYLHKLGVWGVIAEAPEERSSTSGAGMAWRQFFTQWQASGGVMLPIFRRRNTETETFESLLDPATALVYYDGCPRPV